MPWYGAHAVMWVKFKDGNQNSYPIWENILLIQALNHEEATSKACVLARRDEGDSDGSFTWDGRPATWVFAGLRKVLSVAYDRNEEEIGDGDEITFSEFEVFDEESLRLFAAGEPVKVDYVE